MFKRPTFHHLILATTLAGLAGLLSILASLAQADEPTPAPYMAQPKEITVFVAKKVVTMDPALPEAQAVAIADGRILSVGTLEDLKPWLNRYPHKIDRSFADRVIYPGFVEPHGHLLIGGAALTQLPLTYLPLPSPYGPTFPGVKTQEAALAKLKEYSAGLKDPTEPLITWGYDLTAIGKPLNKDILDSISTTRPIVVWDSSEHNAFVNTAAMALHTNVDQAKKVLGVKVAPDGSLTGEFYGMYASAYLLTPIFKTLLAPDKALASFQYVSELGQQNGITTMSELNFGTINIEDELALLKRFSTSPILTQRTVVVANRILFEETYKQDAVQKVLDLQNESSDTLLFRGVKFFSDDAYLSNTMMVQNPAYIDWHEGLLLIPSANEFANLMLPWWNAGFHIHTHTNGTIGNQNTINALQILQDTKPRFNHRFTFEHYGLSSSMNARTIKALGGVVSVNPSYVYGRAHLQENVLGADRAATATRLGTLVREGVVTSMHSDTPVAPPRPLHHVGFAVTRAEDSSGKIEAPAERVTPYQAMRMVTIDAAYTLGVEDKVGSIEPGKYADFTVLAQDPQSVAPEKIKDISVIATIMGGKTTLTSETRKRRPLF